MFKKLPDAAPADKITLVFEGEPLSADIGTSVAAALLAAGVTATRQTYVDAAPRGPYCMMGACFDCLMVIDGIADRQACMVLVEDRMTVARQAGDTDMAS